MHISKKYKYKAYLLSENATKSIGVSCNNHATFISHPATLNSELEMLYIVTHVLVWGLEQTDS